MVDQTRIHVILVIYQIKISDSSAYESLRKHLDHFELIVIDNSTEEEWIRQNHDFCADHHILYRSEGQNLGLSKAYNLGLDAILNTPDHGNWLIPLDQDTDLPAEYFDEVLSLSQGRSHSVYCPNVHSAQGKISPIILRSEYTVTLPMTDTKLRVCINSGLMWNVELLKSLRFDEGIFLDMVDYDIFMQLYAHNQTSQVIPMKSSIRQAFSGDEISTFIKDKTRFMIYSKDFTYFCRKWSIQKAFCFRILLRRALKLSVSHRSLWFTKFVFQVLKTHD